jgi:hypothetical protein
MSDYREYNQYGNLHSPNGIVNTIIFKRQYPGKESQAFLIVEGDTDRKFYLSFVDKEKCEITCSDGKAMAFQVLSIIDQEKIPGVLIIVDADFDLLDDKIPQSQNVIFTDTHDLETMIMRSPAFEKVLRHLASEEKIIQIAKKTGKDIVTILLECGIEIGYLRWVSLREKLSLKFEDLEFSRFIDQDTLHVNYTDLIKSVKNKSQRHDIPDEQLHANLQALKSSAHDPWHICCGHDLINILSIALRKAIGTRNHHEVKAELLEINLRLAFEYQHLCGTQLHASIQMWERANEPFVIFAAAV